MKKIVLLAIVLISAFYSCEKDDICIEETTPKLIIQFYDDANSTELKKVTSLTVWAADNDSIYTNQSLDSIAIPLNLNKDATLYKFSSETLQDEISFNYNRSAVFVSRSCGYKTIFNEIEIASNTSNWIKRIEIINPTIENETTTHIHIFH